MRKWWLAAVAALSAAMPAQAGELMEAAGRYYYVKRSQCVRYVPLTDGYITCYDKKGRSTGTEVALNDQQLQVYLAQQAENSAIVGQLLAQSNQQLQNTVNQGWVTLQQGQQPPAVGNYQYQNSNGVWIRCIRVSNSVVNCREL